MQYHKQDNMTTQIQLPFFMLFFMCVSQVMALKTESDENDREKKAESEEKQTKENRRTAGTYVCVCVHY